MAKLIGQSPQQVPTNADLGDMAYKDGENLQAGPLTIKDGNVGIGTISPGDTLDVEKSGTVSLGLKSTNSSDTKINFGDSSDNDVGILNYAHSDNSMRFTVNASERLRIASSGQLGIGGANYGTSGQVLTSGGSGAAPTWADAGGGLSGINYQVFTSSGTYTPTSGYNYAIVYCTGAGGGGGDASTDTVGGGGGGSGATAVKVYDLSSVTTATVTIGSGGSAGNSGGTTSFAVGATTLSANGGSGGSSGGGNFGIGGAGSTSTSNQDFTIKGNAGSPGSTGGARSTGGAGGSSFWGGGGQGNVAASGNSGSDGSGGGGAGAISSSQTGGTGGNGIVVVVEYK